VEQYFGEEAFPEATLIDIEELLTVGVQDPEQHGADRKEIDEAARDRSWFAVLADFADHLSTSIPDILSMPFPLFVGLGAQVLRLQAARQADFMIAYILARSGDKDLWREITKAAGDQPEQQSVPGPNAEFISRQKEDALHYRQFHGKTGKA
jgi:hypothetical protein